MWRTVNRDEGPYLIISKFPLGTTKGQLDAALAAAHGVFSAAGYDPVQVGMVDTEDAFERLLFEDLWKTAQKAATVAAWTPRAGEPELTEIEIYID